MISLNESQLDALADCFSDLIALARQKRAADSSSVYEAGKESTADTTTQGKPAQRVKHSTAAQRGQAEVTR